MSEEKLAEYKDKLCQECNKLAEEYIEWSNDEAPEWKESLKGRYQMKKDIISRCRVVETMHIAQRGMRKIASYEEERFLG